MRTLPIAVAVMAITTAVADSTDTMSLELDAQLQASFVAQAPAPPDRSVTMQPGGEVADVVRIRVVVKEIGDFFGALFRVRFDPLTAAFLSLDSSTSFLVEPGVRTAFLIGLSAPGELVVVATRFQDPSGSVPGVNVGNADLLVLTFRAIAETGGSAIEFAGPPVVCGSAGPGCDEIPAVWWSGGYLVASFCTDEDQDGYPMEPGCGSAQDCDDSDPDVHPGASEVCNGIDDDCDGRADERLRWRIGSGWAICDGATVRPDGERWIRAK